MITSNYVAQVQVWGIPKFCTLVSWEKVFPRSRSCWESNFADVNILTTDIATGDSLFKNSFYKKSCDQFWSLTWNYIVIMFNSNQSQTLMLITWPDKSALGPKMGNPPPCQGIPFTTPFRSIFVYKNSLRKLWNNPINHAENTTAFWSYQGIIMRTTAYLPDYLHPSWKKL